MFSLKQFKDKCYLERKLEHFREKPLRQCLTFFQGKLVIGHNMLLDVMHTVHQFYCPLPAVSVLSACVKNSRLQYWESVLCGVPFPCPQLSQRDSLLHLVECFWRDFKGSWDGCHCWSEVKHLFGLDARGLFAQYWAGVAEPHIWSSGLILPTWAIAGHWSGGGWGWGMGGGGGWG